MLRKLEWQLPGEPLAARYNWCQGPVPVRGPAVEKHWYKQTALGPPIRSSIKTAPHLPVQQFMARDLWLDWTSLLFARFFFQWLLNLPRIKVHAEGKKVSRHRTHSETYDVSAEGYYERSVLPMFSAVAASLGVTRKVILLIKKKVQRNICNKIIPDTL